MQFGSCHFSARNPPMALCISLGGKLKTLHGTVCYSTPAVPLHTHTHTHTHKHTSDCSFYTLTCLPHSSHSGPLGIPGASQAGYNSKTSPSLLPAYRMYFPPIFTPFSYFLQIFAQMSSNQKGLSCLIYILKKKTFPPYSLFLYL